MAGGKHQKVQTAPKPSYSNMDATISAIDLTTPNITGYRLMHPEPHLRRKCLSTESAVNGQHHIADIPLGAKLPMVPGNQVTLVTTKLGKRLQKPSCDFDISTPSEIFVSNEYNDLHDPHLTSYFQKNRSLKEHLIETGYIDEQGHVICRLEKYNLYRQYLKRLSIDSLNKKYREQFESERRKTSEDKAEDIEKRTKDPMNPINLRLADAKRRRNERYEAFIERSKGHLQEWDQRQEYRQSEKLKFDQERTKKLLQSEKEREKRNSIREMKEAVEKQRIQEVIMRKHYEDQKRLYDLAKTKRKQLKARRKRMQEHFERKEDYRKSKNNELQLLAAEHELRRRQRVTQWEEYFKQQLELQQQRLVKIREQAKVDAKERRMRKQAKKMFEKKTTLLDRLDLTELDLGGGDVEIGKAQSEQAVAESVMSSDDAVSIASTSWSQMTENTKLFKQANFIVKNVLNTVEYGLPTLQAAIEAFEMSHGRMMSDAEVYSLIHKLNNDGRRGSIITYDKGACQFELSAGRHGGTINFRIDDRLMVNDAGWHKTKKRRQTGIFAPENLPTFMHRGTSDEDFINQTVRALSFKVVRSVMQSCGLYVKEEDIADIAIAIIREVVEASERSEQTELDELPSTGRTSQNSQVSAASTSASAKTNSTCMHDLADKVIVELLGLDASDQSTEMMSVISFDEDADERVPFDADDLNLMALDIVKNALRAENGSSNSGTSASETIESAETAIQARLKALSKQVVKNALTKRAESDESMATLQTLPSQDIQYIENRVENLATRILENVMPSITRIRSGERKVQERPISRSSTATSVSTLPDDYDARANDMTIRIIKTLLNLKKMMPHPKPQHSDLTGRTTAATLASCINFNALYNAPKEAFTMNNDEIAGLAQAMTERMNMFDEYSSSETATSPRDGLVGELSTNIVDRIGIDKITPRSDQASSSGTESRLAYSIVQTAVKDGDFTQGIKALSEGGSSLADIIVDGGVIHASMYAEDSAESAVDSMAKQAHLLATELLQNEQSDKDLTSETDSVDGIADRLAGLIVDYGQDKFLKESLDKKADIISKEVSDIAHELIKELLMSAKDTVSIDDSSCRSQRSAGSYRKLHLSHSETTTATLESAFSDAIGALTNTVIRSHPGSDHITRTQSEVALRRLLQVLQSSFNMHEEDAASRGSSAASCLADDLASTVIDHAEVTMNQVSSGTQVKPDTAEAKGTQVDGESVTEQANHLLESIMAELRVSNPPDESDITSTIDESPGFDNESDAATQISRVLVQRLVPHLIDHFRPPAPPAKYDAQTSCFKDFRKTGIYKKRFRPQDYTSTESNSELLTGTTSEGGDDLATQSASTQRMMTKLDKLAMNIVTDTVKDDRIHNVRKADEIHGLVQDLALGIVDTILQVGGSRNGSPQKYGSKPGSPNKRYRKKASTPSSRDTPRRQLGKHEDPEDILARALRRETTSSGSMISSKYKPRPPRSPKKGASRSTCVDKLANQIVDASFVPRSGSSRTTSANSHDCSDIDAMSYKLVRHLPKTVDRTDTETSEDDQLVRTIIPTCIDMPTTSDSDARINEMLEQIIAGSMVEGEDTKSCASSLAENLITKSWVHGQASTKTGNSSVAEHLIAQSVMDAAQPSVGSSELASDLVKNGVDQAIEDVSEGSSLAELLICKSMNEAQADNGGSEKSSLAEDVLLDALHAGAHRAMSKSPASSLAEDMIQNLSPMGGNSSPEEVLADDLLEHVLTDIPSEVSDRDLPNSNYKF